MNSGRVGAFLVLTLLCHVPQGLGSVWCGVRSASSCSACGDSASWCNGECMWAGGECVTASEDSVSCGGYRGPNCEVCTQGYGASRCNGDCVWSNSTCVKAGGSSVSCGEHRAFTCPECPSGNGQAWCQGDCEWDDNDSVCNISLAARDTSLVSCGGHTAKSCAQCPEGQNAGEWFGRTRCNGQCVWSNGECRPANGTSVSCGEHRASSCSECPVGNGAGCHGDCAWDSFDLQSECRDRAVLIAESMQYVVADFKRIRVRVTEFVLNSPPTDRNFFAAEDDEIIKAWVQCGDDYDEVWDENNFAEFRNVGDLAYPGLEVYCNVGDIIKIGIIEKDTIDGNDETEYQILAKHYAVLTPNTTAWHDVPLHSNGLYRIVQAISDLGLTEVCLVDLVTAGISDKASGLIKRELNKKTFTRKAVEELDKIFITPVDDAAASFANKTVGFAMDVAGWTESTFGCIDPVGTLVPDGRAVYKALVKIDAFDLKAANDTSDPERPPTVNTAGPPLSATAALRAVFLSSLVLAASAALACRR